MMLHQLQGPQTALEATLTAFERSGEYFLENSEISKPIFFFVEDIRVIIRVNLSVLPFLLTAVVVLF
jgi:hypothetical protein